MSIKDRLAKKTEGLFVPVAPVAATLNNDASKIDAVSDTGDSGAPYPSDLERAEVRTPRTGPGQMLAFRSHMQESNQRVQELQDRLTAFEGADVTRALDPNNVRPSRWANRHSASFQTTEFETLKLDIQAAGGNVQPIRVRPIEGRAGEFEIVFGHRRHRACLDLGLMVNAVVGNVDDVGLFAAMDRENRGRSDLSPYEQGEMYRRALDEGLFGSLRQMAQSLGVDAGNVSKAMAIARLPKEVVDVFDSPLSIQYRWGQQLHQAMQKDPEGVMERARALRKSSKKIVAAEAVERLVGLLPTAKPAVTPIKLNGQPIGSCTQFATGAVRVDIGARAWEPERVKRMIAAIEEVLKAE